MNFSISVKEALSLGLASLKRDWPQWLALSLVLFVIEAPLGYFSIGENNQNLVPTFNQSLILLLTFVLTMIVNPGQLYYGLQAARGKSVNVKFLVEKSRLALKFMLLFVLYGLAVAIGFMLLIIPGIYLLIRLGMSPYVLLENPKMSVIDALKKSSELTKGKIMSILSAGLIIFVLTTLASLVGTILVGIIVQPSTQLNVVLNSLLYTFPNSLILPFLATATAYIYDAVKKAKSTK